MSYFRTCILHAPIFFGQYVKPLRGIEVAKQRRGMLIKNTNTRPVDIEMKTRSLRLNPGEEKLITAEEVRDEAVREKLQVRAISIVRPSTKEEEDALIEQLAVETPREDDPAEEPEAAEKSGGS